MNTPEEYTQIIQTEMTRLLEKRRIQKEEVTRMWSPVRAVIDELITKYPRYVRYYSSEDVVPNFVVSDNLHPSNTYARINSMGYTFTREVPNKTSPNEWVCRAFRLSAPHETTLAACGKTQHEMLAMLMKSVASEMVTFDKGESDT